MRVTVITLILAAMARVGTASPISADNDLQVADPADLVARNTTIPFESDVDESSQVKFYGVCLPVLKNRLLLLTMICSTAVYSFVPRASATSRSLLGDRPSTRGVAQSPR